VSEQAHAALTFAAEQQREARVKAIQSDRAFSAFGRMTQQADSAQQLMGVERSQDCENSSGNVFADMGHKQKVLRIQRAEDPASRATRKFSSV
jgi:hypothetical protein